MIQVIRLFFFSVSCFLIACQNVTLSSIPSIETRQQVAAEHLVARLQENAQSQDKTQQSLQEQLLPPWWQIFDQEVLNELMLSALSDHYDIQQGLLRLQQTQEGVRVTRSQRRPSVDLIGNWRQTFEETGSEPDVYQLNVRASWQPDLLRRLERGEQIAQLAVVEQSEALQGLSLAVSGAVAEAYFSIVAANQRLQLLQSQLTLDRDLENLLQLRFQKGVGTRVDVLRQQTQVLETKKRIPLAQASLDQLENQLDVLLGQLPDGVPRIPADIVFDRLELTRRMGSVESVPASLLLDRPDLRALSANLAATEVNLELLKTRSWPTITLNGSIGHQQTRFFSGPVANLVADFLQPIVYWGRLSAEQRQGQWVLSEQLNAFALAYLQVIEEVEALLIEVRQRSLYLQYLDQQVAVLAATLTASEERYRQGIDTYLGVIDAARNLRTIEREVITEHLTYIKACLELRLALGLPRPSNKRVDTKI